nr:hypothetical protein [Saliphagus sp. LR7]
MRIKFDGGTHLLREASEDVPYLEWDNRIEDYRAPAYRYFWLDVSSVDIHW